METFKFKRYVRNDPKQKKGIWFYSDGVKEWRLNDALHREDGQAIERLECYHEWWLNGKYYFHEHQYLEALKNIRTRRRTKINR